MPEQNPNLESTFKNTPEKVYFTTSLNWWYYTSLSHQSVVKGNRPKNPSRKIALKGIWHLGPDPLRVHQISSW